MVFAITIFCNQYPKNALMLISKSFGVTYDLNTIFGLNLHHGAFVNQGISLHGFILLTVI